MRKRTWAAVVLAALCLGLLAGCTVDVEKAVEKAKRLEGDGQHAEAVKQYERALEAEPDNVSIQYALYEAAIRANPDSETAWVELLTFCEEQDNRAIALEMLLEYRGQLPESEQVQALIGRYRPTAPSIVYKEEGQFPPIAEFHDDVPVTAVVETTFRVYYDPNQNLGPWVDEIRYKINGEKHQEEYTHNTNNRTFSQNPSLYFSQPGTYNVEMQGYSSECDMLTATNTTRFTIPEDCVGKVTADPTGGSYDTLGGVRLSTDHEDSTIYYTTDGTDPVVWDARGLPTVQGTVCTGDIAMDPGVTSISARCVNSGGIVGELFQATYELKSSHPKIIQRNGGFATDGRYIYLASNHGLFRQNYDGTDETRIFEGRISSVAVLDSGKLLFCATPVVKFNQQNPYYVYYYDNGDIQRSNGRTGEVRVRAIGNAAYVDGRFVPFGDAEEPTISEAQGKATIFNDSYNVYQTLEKIDVSGPDGSNYRTIIDKYNSDEPIGIVDVHALWDDKLIYSTYYHESIRGKHYDSNPPINHYYVLNLSTGERHGCPELEAVLDELSKKGDPFNVLGFTEDSVYYYKEAYINDQRDREWIRMDFTW